MPRTSARAGRATAARNLFKIPTFRLPGTLLPASLRRSVRRLQQLLPDETNKRSDQCGGCLLGVQGIQEHHPAHDLAAPAVIIRGLMVQPECQ